MLATGVNNKCNSMLNTLSSIANQTASLSLAMRFFNLEPRVLRLLDQRWVAGRTLGTGNFYRRNRAVPVLVRMLGFDKNGSHHYESQLQPISAGTAGIRFLGRDTVFCQSAVHLNKTTKCRCHSGFGPPGPNPVADLDPPGPYPLGDRQVLNGFRRESC